VVAERVAIQRALEALSERLYAVIDGARFERRSDLIVLLCPGLQMPQMNGAWVVEDSQAAVEALPEAIAEVEAAGAWPWVQTRSGHERTRRQALELGLTHSERVPGMLMRPGDLAEATAEIEIELVRDGDIDATNEMLGACFEAPKELFDELGTALERIEEASWYVGRVAGEIASTAVGVTLDGATGVFNVATPPEQRGRGYGAALTSRVVRAGFEAGSELAFLQSSEIGHGVYRRLGFRDVEEYVLLTRPFAA
jgi:ribosomal protein S18 acetylase RimI-like enzyme